MTSVIVSSGQIESGLTLSHGDHLTVRSGGVAERTKILSGGVASLQAGGIIDSAVISAGGELSGPGILGGAIYDRGVISGGTLEVVTPNQGSLIDVSAGGLTIGVAVDSGCTETVISGGTVSRATIRNGGDLDIIAGGHASGVVIGAGATEQVGSGAHLSGESIRSGGIEILSVGAHVSNDVVSSGGMLVLEGDIASGESVTATGSATSTTTHGVTLLGGARVELVVRLLSGATASLTADAPVSEVDVLADAALAGPGRVTFVDDFGRVSGVVAIGGAEIRVESGGVALSDVIESGAEELVSSMGLSIEAVVRSGGELRVSSGGIGAGAIIRDGGKELVRKGGHANGTVLSGGEEDDYGKSIGTVVRLSGFETALSGGVASGVVISSGGEADAFVGGSIFGAIVSNGGTLIVQDGIGSGAVISSGGKEELFDGHGSATHDLILSGGLLSVGRGTSVSHETIRSGGILEFGGDLLSGQSITATASVGATTTFAGITISKGAEILINDAVVHSGASMSLMSGAAGTFAVVEAGGSASGPGQVYWIDDFGSVRGVTVVQGNIGVVVESGGLATDDVLQLYASETVRSKGKSSGARVSSGGSLVVSNGGVAGGARISSGGQEVVFSGGLTRSTTVFAGGVLTVSSGGSVASGLTVSGGKAVIGGAMASGQTARFAGSAGILELDDVAAFKAKISGLRGAAKIDLGGFVDSGTETVAWNQQGASGTLTITDGSKVATLTLIGSYTAADFHLAKDGHGGTYVSDSPAMNAMPVAQAAARLVEAAAGFHGRGQPDFTAVHTGGTAVISAPTFVAAAMSGR